MKALIVTSMVLLLGMTAGCSDTPPEENETIQTIGTAQDKAKEIQDKEKERVDEVNETMDQ